MSIIYSIFLTDKASGVSCDWVHDEIGVTFSYILELRDQGRYGFLLPPEQILPTGEETYAGIVGLVKAIYY